MTQAVHPMQLIPEQALDDPSPKGLLSALPAIIRELLRATASSIGDHQRDWLVLDARYGLESKQRTLEEVGQAVLGGATREWARQIEAKGLKRLRRVFENGYAGKGFQLRLSASSLFEDLFGCGPSRTNTVVLEQSLLECLELGPEISEVFLRRLELVFALRDVIRVPGNPPRRQPLWFAGSKKQADALVRLISDVDWLLTTHSADPLSELDIVVELNKTSSGRRTTIPEVRSVLPLCHTIERLEDGRIQGRFEYLSGRANQAYRLIANAGAPLDADAIAREINSRSLVGEARLNRTNLANQMVGDPRLIPIGKSGAWGLRGIHDEAAAPIEKMMRAYLERKGAPAAAEEILAAVAAKRPVAAASVGMYLSFGDTFVRLPDRTWALAEWSEAKAVRRKPKRRVAKSRLTLADHVARETTAALSIAPDRTLPLGALLEHLIKTLGRPKPSLYSYVGRLDFVEKIRVESGVFVRMKEAIPRPDEALSVAEVKALIAGGESDVVEFKASLRWNLKRQFDDRSLEKGSLKSIAAFLNGSGGHLLIGVEDNGGIHGIEKDAAVMDKKGQDPHDVFLRGLASLIDGKLGGANAALVAPRVIELDGRLVCVVAVRPSPKPVFLKDGNDTSFHVRLGTSTLPLGMEQMTEYVRVRWPA